MRQSEQILNEAATNGANQKLDYFGALPPEAAAELLKVEPFARLIDVRTQAELDWVGKPDIPLDQYVHVEWTLYPGGVANPAFIDELRAKIDTADRPLLFLCRSAVRSKHAARAATVAGFSCAIDILEGFEGNRNERGHRKTVEGWCHRGLPWIGA